jgi:hypothetical protein
MNLVESMRSKFTQHELKKPSDWAARKAILARSFSHRSRPTAHEVIDVGEHLSDSYLLGGAFKGQSGQSSLSHGGSTWQVLVGHYLNLCLAGTDAIAINGAFVPPCIKEALKVVYKTNPASNLWPDVDVMVMYAPGVSKVMPRCRKVTGESYGVIKDFAEYVANNFTKLSVVLVQTKTNWNDNAQTPMLWNMVYKLAHEGKLKSNGFSVGTGKYHLSSVSGFSYSFVTVPTNDPTKYKSTSMEVARVAGMTGGAFWGRPSKTHVMNCVSDFFVANMNALGNHFPPITSIGVAYANEVANPTGAIDVAAFDLL